MTAPASPSGDSSRGTESVEGALSKAARMLTMSLDPAAVCEGMLDAVHQHFSAEDHPREADRARLEAFAAQAAIAVTNARLFEASERDRQRLRSLAFRAD